VCFSPLKLTRAPLILQKIFSSAMSDSSIAREILWAQPISPGSLEKHGLFRGPCQTWNSKKYAERLSE
jgi:hypothetical protein